MTISWPLTSATDLLFPLYPILTFNLTSCTVHCPLFTVHCLLYNKLMNEQIFFSVIIPTYNRRPFLEKAVRSVLAQSYAGFELLVVDDGSTDGSGDLLRSFEDPRIRIFSRQNRGVASARNTALKEASGDFVAFLDSDDWWKKNKLKRACDLIREHPEIHIFHTEEVWYRRGRLLNQKNKHKKPSGFVYLNALPLCCISISTAVVKKEVFAETGMFDESMEACEDYDFWLRATSRYKIKLIPEYLTLKDGGRPDQLSSRVWGLDRFRIKALEKMLSSGKLSEELERATLEELTKKCRIFANGAEKRGKPYEANRYRSIPLKYI
ncbi:MAG: glycosyltransferase [Candidatus Omnitrophica bacterium]|nr:glycosyltransferase [Candidatus Omnitrophota bacterium]